MSHAALVLLVTSLIAVVAAPAAAQLKIVPFVTGLTEAIGMVQDPSDPAVQYVVEQAGRIRVIRNGALLPTPFLDFVALGAGNPVLAGGERGLLGLALPPDAAVTGRAYVYFTSTQGPGHIVVARFKRAAADPLTLDLSTRFDLEFSPGQRFIPHANFGNHNGGKLAFGPDGFLYLGPGDGGSGGDPNNHAQNPNSLLGKILRIDVSVADGDPKGYRIPPDNPFLDGNPIAALPEIWDIGVRNPWRFTFDDPGLGGTGALLIADVGQGAFEEVSYEPAGKGGRNYGWALREGAHDFVKSPPAPAAFLPLTEPIYDYDQSPGQSITGGYIYRGIDLGPTYRGRYFLSDFIDRTIASLGLTIDPNTGEAARVQPAQVIDHTAELGGSDAFGNISSIDVDARGELYLVSRSKGTIYKLVLDVDNDTLPDGWEAQFGLDPASAAGNHGATGDPDADGRTNAQELAAGTHPTGNALFTRHLAEGSSSSFFETTVAVANPGAQPASVLLRFLKTGGEVITRAVTLPAQQHLTVRPAELTGLQITDFSTAVESNQEVVVERTMTWTVAERYGSHSEHAVPATSTIWYLAEGATHGVFDTFYLLENPTDTRADVEVQYLLKGGAPITRPYHVDPHDRATIWVDDQPDLGEAEVSAIIRVTNGVGIVVERAMYRTSHGKAFVAGHASAGVTAPSSHWFFAEGATGSFFDMFLLLANPQTAPVDVTVRYLLEGGATPVERVYTLPPQSRDTFNVEQQAPELAAAITAMVVDAPLPILAERAMYWPNDPGNFWTEAHNSVGATETGTAWVVAGGEEGGPDSAQTFVLIANTSSFGGQARVTLLREGAAPLVHEMDLAANSRSNVRIGDVAAFAAALNSRFGVLVESLGATPAQIVIERASYTNGVDGTIWAAGTNSLGRKLR